MKLKIMKGTNDVGRQFLQIETPEAKIAVSFGEDIATAEIPEHVNPMIEGLTCGEHSYNGVFILRNPENCNLVDFTFDNIPIFLEKKVKLAYDVCADFRETEKRKNIKEIINSQTYTLKDLEVTYYLVDSSNLNTSMLLIEAYGRKVLISGDFRNFDLNYGKKQLFELLYDIGKIDYWFIEGKYFGKNGPENASDQTNFLKLKNIMKFYKQVFIIQSETDLATTKRIYDVALKTKKILIEETFLANLTTTLTGSCPNPVTSKKVYTYNPLVLDNKDFEFKKKYVTHFYIHNANNKMKKEKYVMNLNIQMLQDMQVFSKEDVIYDACLILAINKKHLKINKDLEEFINMMKDFDLDYYELYAVGAVNYNLINDMFKIIKPKVIIPLEYHPIEDVDIYNIRNLRENEIIEL